jgi:hypothetical protein
MFFHYNDRYINLSGIGSVEPHGAGYTLYDWDGEAITDVPKDEWRKAVERPMPVLPAAPGFTLVGFAIDDDGDPMPCGDYPIVAWRAGDYGTAEPICVGVPPDAFPIAVIKDGEGRVIIRYSWPTAPPRFYASLDEAWPEIKKSAERWARAEQQALAKLRAKSSRE